MRSLGRDKQRLQQQQDEFVKEVSGFNQGLTRVPTGTGKPEILKMEIVIKLEKLAKSHENLWSVIKVY